MSDLHFQLDEDCQASALCAAMRQHGLTVATTNELALTGVDDETQLKAAASNHRVIVTNNIRDFVPLHTRWIAEDRPAHSGIVVFLQQSLSLAETVRRLSSLNRALTSRDMNNRLEWLSNWSSH